MHFREASIEDVKAIVRLYKTVARSGGAIARTESEVDEEYVNSFVSRSISSGLIIVGEDPDNPDEFICEIHAYKSGIAVFNHVLTDLTIVVHPEHQGRRLGRTIFSIFLSEIHKNRPDIGKVELITRESNSKAIALYQSLGFLIEGRLEMRIHNAHGGYEADIPMGWQNPNYEF